MLEEMQRVWDGESFGFAGEIGPRSRPSLIIGGGADVAFERAARYGDGWIMGGGAPDQFRAGLEKAQAAWKAAGRDGAPRTLALAYFALGDGAREAADAYLRDYYAFLGEEIAGMIAGSAATDADTVRARCAGLYRGRVRRADLLPRQPRPGSGGPARRRTEIKIWARSQAEDGTRDSRGPGSSREPWRV